MPPAQRRGWRCGALVCLAGTWWPTHTLDPAIGLGLVMGPPSFDNALRREGATPLSFLDDLDACSHWHHSVDNLRQYVVGDIPPHEDTPHGVVLLLESPHCKEVEANPKHPLAGSTGERVTCALSDTLGLQCEDRKRPFGELLSDPAARPSAGIGVMNASQLPMQARPYSDSNRPEVDQQALDQLIGCFTTILRGPGAQTRRNDLTREVEGFLQRDLLARIERTSPGTCFVLCGRLAENLFLKATRCSGNRWPSHCPAMPHPARVRWSGANHLDKLNRLKRLLRNRLGLDAP